ncbi:hypothetical protein [Gehongia tenuis]|uniref:GerMN domain-containing protein n=1 Tax=Gehongia tenuis TaxID=2763655 RepID=A0A926D2D3_9FIRM|nr:hypothetical protein [Gehongia tenuis]MBC8530483.1 hypothetical protein [Gehongia tenuis]
MKKWMLLPALAIGLGLLTACGGETGGTPSAPAATAKPSAAGPSTPMAVPEATAEATPEAKDSPAPDQDGAKTPPKSSSTKPEKEWIPEDQRATLYVVLGDSVQKYDAVCDRNASVNDQTMTLIHALGKALGMEFEVLDITNGKGGMTINFSKDSFPVNPDGYLELSDDDRVVHFFDYETSAFSAMDSIKMTLQEHFGGNMPVYFTCEGGDIFLKNLGMNGEGITVPGTEPYTKASDFIEGW